METEDTLYRPLNYWLKKEKRYMTEQDKTDIHAFLVLLGNYVSHEVIWNKSVRDSIRSGFKRKLLSPNEINKINRYDAAEYFVDVYCHEYDSYGRYGRLADSYASGYNEGREGFIADIAYEIDKRIPRAYKKNILHDGDRGPSQTEFTNGEYGLYYQLPLMPADARRAFWKEWRKKHGEEEESTPFDDTEFVYIGDESTPFDDIEKELPFVDKEQALDASPKSHIRLPKPPLATRKEDGPIRCSIEDIPQVDELPLEIMGKITSFSVKRSKKYSRWNAWNGWNGLMGFMTIRDETGEIEIIILSDVQYFKEIIEEIIYEDLNAYVYGNYSLYDRNIILTDIEAS